MYDNLITQYGAKEVYQACADQMAGNPTSLKQMGVYAQNLGEVNKLMTRAHEHLSPNEKKQFRIKAEMELSSISNR